MKKGDLVYLVSNNYSEPHRAREYFGEVWEESFAMVSSVKERYVYSSGKKQTVFTNMPGTCKHKAGWERTAHTNSSIRGLVFSDKDEAMAVALELAQIKLTNDISRVTVRLQESDHPNAIATWESRLARLNKSHAEVIFFPREG